MRFGSSSIFEAGKVSAIRNIVSIAGISGVTASYETPFSGLTLPSVSSFNLSDGSRLSLPVSWSKGSYQLLEPSTYTLYGTPTVSGNITNTSIVQSQASVILSLETDFIPVIFDIGQSNSIGRAESDRLALTSYSKTPNNVKIYYKTAYGATDNGSFVDIDASTNTKEPDAAGSQRTFGAYLPLATKLRDYLARTVYVVAAGDGGTALSTGITSQTWNPTTVGSCFDRATLQYFNVAMTKLAAANPGKRIVIFINWHQGESDAGDAGATAAYATKLNTFFIALRASNVLLNNAYLVITKIWFTKSGNEALINNAITGYTTTHSEYVNCISISDLPQKDELTVPQIGGYTATTLDDNHQSYLAQIGKGERIFAKIVDKLNLTLRVPTNTVIPTIAGTAKVGNILTGSTGTWLGSGFTYTYQWKRAGVNVSSATGTTFTLTSSDYNKVIFIHPFYFNSIYRSEYFLFGKVFKSIMNKEKMKV